MLYNKNNASSKFALSNVFLFTILVSNSAFSASYTFSGSGGPYNLNAGDTLTIESGEFTQGLNFPSGVVINVASGASFKPSSLNNSAGTLLVNSDATVVLPAVGLNGGMVIDNSGDFTFSSSVNMNGSISITNRSQTTGLTVPTMRFVNGYQLSQISVIDNQGLMTFQQDFNIDSNSTLKNAGTITMENFNPSGFFVNNGFIRATGFINVNTQSEVINNCTFYAEEGFNNNSSMTENHGIIITVDPLSNIQINSTFYQSAGGYLQGGGEGAGYGFINNSLVSGGGNYYFVGETRNNGIFGNDTDSEIINFYDAVLADDSKYFDVEVYPPVDTTKNSISPITGAQALENCTYGEIFGESDLDYGDAPVSGIAPDGSSAINYGEASHAISGSLYLGDIQPDQDDANQQDEYAVGDDNDGLDDEDGVQFPTMIRGEGVNLSVSVSGANGYLQAWIDWNGDGAFSDADEQIATNLQGTDSIDIAVTVPSDATLNPTFARFRWSSSPDIGSTGFAGDGEVEDYTLTITESGDESSVSCVMDDIAHAQYSSSSPAASSRFLTDKTYVYEATFDTEDWSGEIIAYNLTTEEGKGGIKSKVWSSSSTIGASGRELYSYNPEASTAGIALNWDNLNGQQQSWLARNDGAAMGLARLNWLKGVTDTTEPANSLRTRSTLIGDIVHSSLTLRDPLTNYGYKSLPGAEGTAYASFLAAKVTGRASLLVGSNNGMYHALDPETGSEHFAYVPNEVFSRLANISDPKYGCDEDDCLSHEYMVDGVSTLGDAYLSTGWRSVVIGTLGLGGKGIFALNVTDPNNFSAADVLWEISSTQAPDNVAVFASHLGYTQAAASIVRLKSGRWAAVFGNGYKSDSQQAVLFIVDVETGELIKTINTFSGSETLPNGLSTPTVIDIDGDSIADRIYAGDLLGNVWSFDISSADETEWSSSYGTSASPEPFFQACIDNSCSKTQAITAAPQIGKHQQSGLMVYVGTGKYVDVSDNNATLDGPGFNSFYGLQDKGIVVMRSQLVEQKILAEVDIDNDLKARVTSDNTVDYAAKQGWVMNLLAPPSGVAKGESVVSKAILRNGRIIFTTLTPSTQSCVVGGSSWLMEINAQDGARLSTIAFDVNDDLAFTDADNTVYNGDATVVSGLQQTSLGLIRSAPVIVQHTTHSEGKYVSGSEEGIGMFRESTSHASGRMSWANLGN